MVTVLAQQAIPQPASPTAGQHLRERRLGLHRRPAAAGPAPREPTGSLRPGRWSQELWGQHLPGCPVLPWPRRLTPRLRWSVPQRCATAAAAPPVRAAAGQHCRRGPRWSWGAAAPAYVRPVSWSGRWLAAVDRSRPEEPGAAARHALVAAAA